jgi:hypothetical protein
MFNWSTMKIQLALGSVAMTSSLWQAKSASVRVGPTEAARNRPVATPKLAIKASVPCRIYSNSPKAVIEPIAPLMGLVGDVPSPFGLLLKNAPHYVGKSVGQYRV